MFWKLVFTRQYTWLNSPDVAGQVLPWFQLQAASLHRWSLTLWDPYQWCGHPLAAEGQSGTLYPLNWLLWAMPLHRTWLRHVYLNWYFVLIHFQAALFAYWLCRDQVRSRAASLAGATAFAFGPLLGSSVWPAALNATAWAPLQLMFFLRARRNARPAFSAAACGAALGASWLSGAGLSGAGEIPVILSLTLAALWSWRAYETRSVREPVLATLTALGIGAMQILPGLEYLRYSPRILAARGGAAWQAKALSPISFVNFFAPGAGDPVLFIGWAALALAAIGIWRNRSAAAMRICLVLAAAALAIAVGPRSMFAGALYGARLVWQDPRSALCLLALALPLPVAAGLDAVREGAQPRELRRILLAAAVLCGVGLFLLSMTSGDNLDALTPLALCGLVALATFALLEARAREAISPRAAGVLAVLLLMWQFGHVAGIGWKNIEFGWPYLTRLADSSDLAVAVRSQPIPARIADPDGSAGFNVGDWHGIEQFDGLSGGTDNIASVADLPAARALGGAAFVIANKAPAAGAAPAFLSRSGIKMYSAPDAFPRAWVVSRAAAVAADSDARTILGRPLNDFRTTAFLRGGAPALGGCEKPGIANLIARKQRRLTVRAAAGCPAMVVISQTFYPEWCAFVDGKPANLYQVDGFLDGVAVPAGEHTINLVYRPWTVWIGAAISLATAVWLLIVYRRRFA